MGADAGSIMTKWGGRFSSWKHGLVSHGCGEGRCRTCCQNLSGSLEWLNLLVWWPFLGATWKVPCLKLRGISEQCISEPLGILVFSALTLHMKPRNLLNRSLVEPDCGTNRCIYFVPNLTVCLWGRSNRFGWNLLVAEMFAAISARECISIASLKQSFSTSCKK